MRALIAGIVLLALPALASPPSNYPADFTATVTLTGVTEREHFTWQSTAWRNDPEPLWDLVLSPPDQLQAFVLTDLNSAGPNVALYLGENGQFFVFDPANNIRDVSPAFGVPEPGILLPMLGLMLLQARKTRRL